MDVGLVCDSCSTFNPMGTKGCTRCGQELSLDRAATPRKMPHDTTPVVIEMKRPARVPCPTCGSMVIAGHKFCGQCGASINVVKAPLPATATAPMKKAPRAATAPARRRTQFFGAMQASRAKLVVIRGDGLDGVSFTLAGDEHLVGRGDTPIQFEDDVFISPVHANFYYDAGTLMVRDEDSTNGVYIRIKGTVPIQYGSSFLVGEQLLQLLEPPTAIGPTAIEDGTYYFTSPPKPAFFRVAQRIEGGEVGMLYLAYKPSVEIGREDNDIDFPNDPFISGIHARVSLDGEHLMLTDLDSKNGTFLRIEGEQALQHGDYVFMGQQLLRVEIV